ncbi:roadblock/LC7 domain protein [Mariprofundus micogutta]|uniref:Roadblock/LC7 domain protein n=1 Tax=Mariprofundus micogutta TaxID=1921010 RepID=A0A1L8CLT0_9PROT|nr:roadblock/LC7 domain-containing protein [Mariprofundus micogutta]GAV19864.1 roadblock/LC7 domain protein [Mariprofundus micogutta]
MSDYKEACSKELSRLVERETHLDAALLCSVDGLPVAYASSVEIEADALSAMCSSMLSLGDALAIQGGDDNCIQVVTQSRGRTVALIHAGEDMLLGLMGSRELKLGMLLGHARKEVEVIVELINKSQHEEKQQEEEKAPSAERQPALLEELVKRVMQEAQER